MTTISAQTMLDAANEASRAHELHGIDSMLSPYSNDGKRLAILMEEVGEVATECIILPSGPNLYTELTQVAAMAMTWMEQIKRIRGEVSGQESQPHAGPVPTWVHDIKPPFTEYPPGPDSGGDSGPGLVSWPG